MFDVLLKVDCIGHMNCSELDQLQQLTGIDPKDIPLRDDQVMQLFLGLETLGVSSRQILTDAGTYGIPEFFTSFVLNILKKTEPQSVSDLIAISGLSHGTDIWLGNGEEWIASGEATLADVPACRDDVMAAMLAKGIDRKNAFRIMETIRKGRGLTQDMIHLMVEHGVEKWYIKDCQRIRYMFPRAHAAAYVMTSLQVAWFKIYQPTAFYTVMLNRWRDDMDAGDWQLSADELRRAILEERSDEKRAAWDKGRMRGLELLLEAKERHITLLQ